ncbi:MAG: hypothetical protein IJS91_00610 [Bacteroidales bacterium]|nr:hypothetical protein [Bacteroidales bacterium]
MRKTLILLLLLASATFVRAQGPLVERTFVTTDRDVYLAGETVWCSAFCVDAATGVLSPLSGTAFLELHSARGRVLEAKVALSDGRGGGSIALPQSLPTGNYRLVAYTSQNRNEQGYQFDGLCSKTLSVYNIFSRERIEESVQVVESLPVAPAASADEGDLTLTLPETFRSGSAFSLQIESPAAATVSVSVSHADGLPGNANPTIGAFLGALPTVGTPAFHRSVLPDYEGEIIRGRIVGFNPESQAALTDKYAFLSAPGNLSDIYASEIDSVGGIVFYTGNIYGQKELITEIEGIDPKLNCHIELESPFVAEGVTPPAPLQLCAGVAEILATRAATMQIERRFMADTLQEYLPRRDNVLFEDNVGHRYHLDYYTRFPVMKEIFIEFVHEVTVRERGGVRTFHVAIQDGGSDPRYARQRALVLLDGVPVFDHGKICDYDPLLVENIDIYPYIYFIGGRQFDGIVNFVTYKRNLPSMKFGNNVRVVNYQGVSYPTAYRRALQPEDAAPATYPDYRQTAYWHPLVRLTAGKALSLEGLLPDYPGDFVVTVEGMTADGRPLRAERRFSVK